jgi:hypothetical protein
LSSECSEVLDSLQRILDEAAADPKIGTASFYEKVRNKNSRTLLNNFYTLFFSGRSYGRRETGDKYRQHLSSSWMSGKKPTFFKLFSTGQHN